MSEFIYHQPKVLLYMSGILFGFCTRNNFDTIFYTQEGGIDASSQIPIVPRYGEHRGLIEQIVMEAVKEHLNRRQGTDNITRNFLRFLTSVCGLIEVKFNLTLLDGIILLFLDINRIFIHIEFYRLIF